MRRAVDREAGDKLRAGEDSNVRSNSIEGRYIADLLGARAVKAGQDSTRQLATVSRHLEEDKRCIVLSIERRCREFGQGILNGLPGSKGTNSGLVGAVSSIDSNGIGVDSKEVRQLMGRVVGEADIMATRPARRHELFANEVLIVTGSSRVIGSIDGYGLIAGNACTA